MRVVKELIEDGREIIEEGKEVIEERKELVEDLFEKAEEYLKTNLELYKLKATDKVSEIVSSLVSGLAMILIGFFFFLLINIGIAIWLGKLMGETHYGFMVLAGFYGLVTLALFLFRKSLIKTPVSNSIISQMLK